MPEWKQLSGRITAEQMAQIKAIRAEKNLNSDVAVVQLLLENPTEPQKIEVEKIVEVEKPLTENQFLVEFDQENFVLIKAVCEELKIQGSNTQEQFHALTEKALIFYIQEKYSK